MQSPCSCIVKADRRQAGSRRAAPSKLCRGIGADTAEPNRRGPKALAELVKSEIARLIPILKAATN